MTKDDIISMAREAEIPVEITAGNPSFSQIEHFADLVAAAERKACAALCSEVAAGRDAEAIEEAILARGEK
jgi:hypothetical protein